MTPFAFLLVSAAFLSAATTVSAAVSGVIAVGLGGTDEYREMYEQAASLTQNAIDTTEAEDQAVPEQEQQGSSLGSLADEDSVRVSRLSNGSGVSLMLETSTDKESLLSRIDQHIDYLLAEKQAGRNHRFMLALFGHGSFDGEDYKFNIKGPDITAKQLAEKLERLEGIQQILMIATSASGAALPILEAPERVVITATKSGAESNAVQFPKFWTAALEDDLLSLIHI